MLVPFGNKPDGTGQTLDFDAVYPDLIAPAISSAGMEPLRADEEIAGGLIHKPMYERLILCEYAVADLATANANVFWAGEATARNLRLIRMAREQRGEAMARAQEIEQELEAGSQ